MTIFKVSYFIQIIASKKGLDWRSIKTLGQLQNKLGLPLADMTSIFDSILHKAPYSKQEICDLLGVTTDELNSISLSERTYGGGLQACFIFL